MGGVLVSIVQKLISEFLTYFFGVGFLEFEGLYPIIFIFVVLMIEPEGIMDAFNGHHAPLKAMMAKLSRIKSLISRDG